ncbi:hypothetical protein IWX46DRAFT_131435 [Phyllosticta citricarpa]|uniref:Uncharacterized protein n=1 Tax=Phyllosticta citricarpa TaxID=55181 RepID=A0ABR1MP79_9PEZI
MCCQPRAAASLVLHSRASILGRRERATVAPTPRDANLFVLCWACTVQILGCPPDLSPREDATFYTTYDTFDIAAIPLDSSLATRFSNNPAYFYALSVSSLSCNHLACCAFASEHSIAPTTCLSLGQPLPTFSNPSTLGLSGNHGGYSWPSISSFLPL